MTLAPDGIRPAVSRWFTPAALAPPAVAAAFAITYLPVLVHAVGVWWTYPPLSFGFFGPPAAALMVFARRRRLAAAAGPGTAWGLALLGAGLLALLAGRVASVNAVIGLSLLPTALGAAAYVYGFQVARLLQAPVAVLTATLSVYLGFLNSLGFALQQVTAWGAAALAAAGGAPVRRSGVDLFVGSSHFVVAQPCSGMDSLLALLFLGFVTAAFANAPWTSRLLLFAAAIPIALATNVVRVTVVLLTSAAQGINLEAGLSHQLLSAGVFLVAALIFLSLGVLLGCIPRLRAA